MSIKVYTGGLEGNSDIDTVKLLESVVFLYKDILEIYEDSHDGLEVAFIEEQDKDFEGLEGFFIVHDNKLHIQVFVNYIKDMQGKNFIYNSFEKSLFYGLLKQFGQALDFLEMYCEHEYSNVDEFFEIWENDPAEVQKFVFKNLSYFENVYNFNGIYQFGLEEMETEDGSVI